MKIMLLLVAIPVALSQVACATARQEHDFVFDSIRQGERHANSRTIDRLGISGRCSFSFSASGSDSSTVLKVEREGHFVRIDAGDWTLSIPFERPLPKNWSDNGGRYIYLGKAQVVIDGKNVPAEKVLHAGDEFGDTEFLISDQYGLLGYMPVESGVQFILSRIPEYSLFDCK